MSEQIPETPKPSPLVYIAVVVAIIATLQLLINFAARPWGWPEGTVEQHEAAAGEHH